MKRSIVAVFGLLLTGSAALSAQTPGPQVPSAPGEVRGSIIENESKQPLPSAAVAVRSKRDSSLISGAMAGPDGKFVVSGLRPGAYYVRVTKIGFGPQTKDFVIAPDAPRQALAPITLGKVAISLATQEIVAEKAAMTVEADRNAYSAKQVAPAATNASEVLDAVPSVQVDHDGKVSLRGNENVAVQINGRVSPMRGAQLGQFLKTLPSGVVDKIEVIPNPSAKYDPEGMAGIINIVLKENVDLGLSGGFNVAGATAGRYNTNGNIGYQSGPFTTFTSYGFNYDERDVLGFNNRERLDAVGAATRYTNQDILGLQANAGHNVTTTIDYKPNKRDVITNSVILNRRHGADNNTTGYTEINSSNAVNSRYDRIRGSNTTSQMVDYTLAWKRTLEPRKHEVSTEFRVNHTGDKDNTSQFRVPLNSTNSVERELDNTDAVTKTLNAQLDYMRVLKPGRKLETGFKGTERWLDRDYLVTKDLLGNNQWAVSNLSNDFSFSENVSAGYAVLSQAKGKFDLQGGLRAEYASRDFSLSKTNENFPYSYTSLFPSGNVSYKKSDLLNLKASYSRRIRRPGTQELNPFPQFLDPQNALIGNPNLSPEYTDAFELGLTKSGGVYTFQLQPFYRHTTNVIRVDINTDGKIDGRDVTTVSFKNLASNNSWGTDATTQLRFGKKFNGLVGLNVFKTVTDGGSETALTTDAIAFSGRLNGNLNITDALSMSANYRYQAPQKIEKGRFAANQQTFISFRQKVYGEKGSVTLRFVDPFNTIGFRIKTGNETILQNTKRTFGVRGTFLSFNYNFGQTPKIRQPQPQDAPPPSSGFPSGG
ncbi:MAG: TonB-dependent receptor [Gemmatimonadaceae bacterium]|nr:TonB-dependent receptor [Gemmatimonadaceae bacterium]